MVLPGPIVAVTGSNGKTTTTTLIAHVFETADIKHVVAGNIGYPFSDYVDDLDAETAVVLEVSSFQLDHVVTFRPFVSVLLNITPDHLDRYDHDFGRYAASKFRIFENQQPGDWLVFSQDDDLVRDHVTEWAAARGLVPSAFSADGEPAPGAFVRDDRIVLALPSAAGAPITEEDLMPASDLALTGRHNLYNSLASAIVARAMEIRSDVVRESLTSFEGVPHRLETVRTVGGVRYVNDSKATNVNAVWYALESFPATDGPNVVLIAGGRDKGNDYGPLSDWRPTSSRASSPSARAPRPSRTPWATTCPTWPAPSRWSRPSSTPGSWPSPATPSSSAPRAPRSTCSTTTRTAVTPSSDWSAPCSRCVMWDP